ncbi:MAG: LysR family transcriptional regulator [Rubrivivax sp.]
MDRLTCMAVFRCVVERNSFSAAAEALAMSPGSVSKHVAALEAHVGSLLLARSTRRLSLTEAGRGYHERVVCILDEIADAERAAARLQPTPRGLLKVRAPVSLGSAYLGRTTAAFLARYPEVELELTLNDQFVDPSDAGFDVAIAIGAADREPVPGARAIGRMPRVIAAAPSYLQTHGTPSEPDELKRHNCLVYSRGATPDEWQLETPGGPRTVRVAGNCRCNNSLVLRQALLEGAGIGLLPAFLLADDIAAGRLLTVLPLAPPEARTLYAVLPQPRVASAKVREFIDFVARGFAGDDHWRLAAA